MIDQTARRIVLAAMVAAPLGACSSNGPVKSIAQATGFATNEPQRPGFIEQSRPGSAGFISVGVPQTTRPKPKTAAEVKKVEGEMDGIRTRHERAAAAAASSAPAPTN